MKNVLFRIKCRSHFFSKTTRRSFLFYSLYSFFMRFIYLLSYSTHTFWRCSILSWHDETFENNVDILYLIYIAFYFCFYSGQIGLETAVWETGNFRKRPFAKTRCCVTKAMVFILGKRITPLERASTGSPYALQAIDLAPGGSGGGPGHPWSSDLWPYVDCPPLAGS